MSNPSRWQPIETYDKAVGEEVLLAFRDGFVTHGYYLAGYEAATHLNGWRLGCEEFTTSDEPYKWMPMPKPPEGL
jgi:hypothetical protein